MENEYACVSLRRRILMLHERSVVSDDPGSAGSTDCAHGTRPRGTVDWGRAEWVFEVDALELADAPHVQTFEEIHLVEHAP